MFYVVCVCVIPTAYLNEYSNIAAQFNKDTKLMYDTSNKSIEIKTEYFLSDVGI